MHWQTRMERSDWRIEGLRRRGQVGVRIGTMVEEVCTGDREGERGGGIGVCVCVCV